MSRRALIIFGIIIFVVIFAALFILSLSRSAQNRRQEAVKEIVGKENVVVLDVVQDPLVYDGLTIQVEAPITDWVTKKSFTLFTGQRAGLLAGGEQSQLLVITRNPLPLPIDAEGSEVGLGETINVRIIGRVRIMDRAELGRALGIDFDAEKSDIELDDNEAIVEWEEGSVIIAESVEKL